MPIEMTIALFILLCAVGVFGLFELVRQAISISRPYAKKIVEKVVKKKP